MYLVTKWFGTFLFDNTTVIKEILFPKNAEQLAQRLQKIKNKSILDEEKTLAQNNSVIVNEKRLEPLGTYDNKNPFFKSISLTPETYDFSQELFHTVSLLLAQHTVDDHLQSEDLQIIQMVNALDDLIQTANLISERLRCWSLIPTPEEKIQPFCEMLSSVHTEIQRLEHQIEYDMKQVAPNTSRIVGSLIGARLISLAGGMQKLAMLPTSTVQILGAEKALFRFKKEGSRPPKHGVLFQHSLINKSPKNTRGKIARILAAKTATAAKADAFTKRDIADELLEELKERLKEVRNK